MKSSMPPVCQSCANPMEFPRDSGTEANGEPSKDYCRECYQDGRFTNPALTIHDVISRVAAAMPDMEGSEARALARDAIPKLKRWRFYWLKDSFIWLPLALMLGGLGFIVIGLFVLAFKISKVSLIVSGSCVLLGLLLLGILWLVNAAERRQMQEMLGMTAKELGAEIEKHKKSQQ